MSNKNILKPNKDKLKILISELFELPNRISLLDNLELKEVIIHLSGEMYSCLSFVNKNIQGFYANNIIHDKSKIENDKSNMREHLLKTRKIFGYQLYNEEIGYNYYSFENLKNHIESELNKRKVDVKKKKTTTKTTAELKDFFNPEIDQTTIDKIQERFMDYGGKRLGYLIHILELEKKLITITINSKIKGRNRFAYAFTKNKDLDMQGVNHYYSLVGLNLKGFDSKEYFEIKEKLELVLNKSS